VGNRSCSIESINLACKVDPVFHLSNIYYGSLEESIQYLLARGLLIMQFVKRDGILKKVIMTDNEGKYYRKHFRMRMQVQMSILPMDEVEAALVNIII
jgi:hypothetical protein